MKSPWVDLIEALAPLVWEERCQEAQQTASRHQTTPWYFLNINHPVIKQLYMQYLKHSLNGTRLTSPPGDLDRVRFELSLLHPAVLRRLAERYRKAGKL